MYIYIRNFQLDFFNNKVLKIETLLYFPNYIFFSKNHHNVIMILKIRYHLKI